MKPLLSFLFVCAFLHGNAQRVLPLDEAIALALQNNYDIRLSRNDSAVAVLDYAFSQYAFYPRLNATGSLLFNNNNSKQTLADGSKRERDGIRTTAASASVNLNWTLFDGLRMFITRRRLAQLIDLGELQIKAQVVNTVADVQRIYFDIVRQMQQLKAVEEQIALAEERLKLAQYKFEVGTGVKPDVLQAQIDLNAQRSAKLTQQTAIVRLKEQLNNLLALEMPGGYTVADTIPINAGLQLDSVQAGMRANNPQLLLNQKGIEVANLQLQERRAERFPTLSFNSAYNFNRTSSNQVINQFSPLFNLNSGFNYGLTAAIPIFNGFNVRRNIRAAELDIRFRQLAQQRTQASLATSMTNVWQDYNLHRQTLALEEENIKLVRENLFIARERYRLGVSTFLEMRIAEQSLAEAATRLIQARFNTKVAEIELRRLQGDLVR